MLNYKEIYNLYDRISVTEIMPVIYTDVKYKNFNI